MRVRGRVDGERNRAAVLVAAEQRLRDSGDFTMSDLARDTGLTRATVYRHFADAGDVLDALARTIADDFLPPFLDSLDALPLDEALERFAHDVVEVASTYRHVIRPGHRSLADLARVVVPGEPFATFVERRRAAGEPVAAQDDHWLAACVRSLCIAAVDDERAPAEVSADLAHSLRRLVVESSD